MKFVFGIDPGFKGAVAVFDAKTHSLLDLFDLPLGQYMGRTEIDGAALRERLAPYRESAAEGVTRLAAIEDVSAMPKQGVTGMFRFGFGTGLLHGLFLSDPAVRILRIKSSVWKNALGLSPDKSASVAKARSLFPSMAHHFDAKRDGRAEAALIGHFAIRYFLSRFERGSSCG